MFDKIIDGETNEPFTDTSEQLETTTFIDSEDHIERIILLEEAYNAQLELKELRAETRRLEKLIKFNINQAISLGANESTDTYYIKTTTKKGNRTILPSRFMDKYKDIFDKHVDDLVTITISNAEKYLTKPQIDVITYNKPSTTSHTVAKK